MVKNVYEAMFCFDSTKFGRDRTLDQAFLDRFRDALKHEGAPKDLAIIIEG